jgi:peptide/nickel transport system permease protein
MGKALLRRVLLFIPVLFGTSVLLFVAGRIATPNPSTTALPLYATPEARQEFIRERHLDEPLLWQYVLWVRDAVHGDFGRSLVTTEPVSEAIAHALPVTIFLALGSLLLTAIIGLSLGSIAGLRPGGVFDRALGGGTIIGVSVPSFFLGVLLIQVFAVKVSIFPAGGYVSPGDSFTGFLKSMALPWITLSVASICVLARVTRARIGDEHNRPHVRTAQALGVSRRRTNRYYVLRNSTVEPTTVLGLQFGYMLGGVVLVEQVFGLPGVGSIALYAANQGDFPVIQATALLAMLIFMVASLLVDMLHIMLDRGVARGV